MQSPSGRKKSLLGGLRGQCDGQRDSGQRSPGEAERQPGQQKLSLGPLTVRSLAQEQWGAQEGFQAGAALASWVGEGTTKLGD